MAATNCTAYALPRRQDGFPLSRLRRPSTAFRFSCSSSPSSSDSYLDMWKKAMDREWMPREEGKGIPQSVDGGRGSVEKMTEQFNRILEVPREERDHVQRLQAIDRAAAAIAAARALVEEFPSSSSVAKPVVTANSFSTRDPRFSEDSETNRLPHQQGWTKASTFDTETGGLSRATPGPDFWSWSPPEDTNDFSNPALKPEKKLASRSRPSISLMEKEKPLGFFMIPFQSTWSQNQPNHPLPHLQSLEETKNLDALPSTSDLRLSADEHNELSLRNAAEVAEALLSNTQTYLCGANSDGSMWWKEIGIEERADGVFCKWTLSRGVSSDGSVEWEDKYWEAANDFGYKELGSEKSGRDATGNIWQEYWKEALWLDFGSGNMHIENTADKWGKNAKGEEWHETWWEHHDNSGRTEKWAHKRCSIDPKTPLEAGHAHVWHERWGEKYDGQGSSTKYTDKWAERSTGYGWAKWGDKWDEHFDMHGRGVKQGETWWEGEHGDRWNRTWGEHHNASGWVHKYGKSTSGEHWDTHVQQDTWYERYPHYGFDHCMENSVQLRAVQKP